MSQETLNPESHTTPLKYLTDAEIQQFVDSMCRGWDYDKASATLKVPVTHSGITYAITIDLNMVSLPDTTALIQCVVDKVAQHGHHAGIMKGRNEIRSEFKLLLSGNY